MSDGSRFSSGRYDRRKWAVSNGSRFEVRNDLEHGAEDEVEPTETGERGHVTNVYESEGEAGDVGLPVGGGLFGGPGADLFGGTHYSVAEPMTGPPSGGFAAPVPREEVGGPSSLSLFAAQRGFDAGGYDQQAFEAGHSLVPVAAEPVPETGSLVRPYTRTGGRTRPDYDLALEALVETSERGRYEEAAALPEHRSICGLCMETRSVAEVAAYLRLPLGVVRVLIGDMAGLGLVMIHQSGLLAGDRPSLAFLERVLSGLRKL